MKKVLIANRGEIALRIIRSLKEMGISTVAVYSSADRLSCHVKSADEAVFIGNPLSSESYLVKEKIIAAAKLTGAEGIHPGYGFLSENASFAQMVVDAGLIFIGPSSEAMEMMGNKLSAKQAAEKHQVPLVPGTSKPIDDINEAKRKANEIGYPILIKAAAGGGGKGMRVVEKEVDFEEQITRASSEALTSFGDGSVFLERFVTNPRHIEIQVLCDKYGNGVYLFERECSIQRRHQKVVEEAPSVILTPSVRKEMGESALRIAAACKYSGVGTVEFLCDDKLNFYFLEMNTRLQVEHPVTEMITGIDLVKEQVKVARGEKLSLRQDDLTINGHAIELRICAEDPSNNFLPDTGNLTAYRPSDGNGVRVDSGYEEGMNIPVYYDPLIAKMIVHAPSRKEAINKMIRSIDEFQLEGIKTTLPFGRFVMEHEAFVSGNFDTNFVGKYFNSEAINNQIVEEERVATILLAWVEQNKENFSIENLSEIPAQSLWKRREVKR